MLANVNGSHQRGGADDGDSYSYATRPAGRPTATVRDNQGGAPGSTTGAPGLQGQRRDGGHEGADQGADLAQGQPTERPRSAARPGLGPVGTHLRGRDRWPGQAPATGHPPPMAEASCEQAGEAIVEVARCTTIVVTGLRSYQTGSWAYTHSHTEGFGIDKTEFVAYR